MNYLLGSDPTDLVAIVLATVATGLTSLIVLLIYFWWTALFDNLTRKDALLGCKHMKWSDVIYDAIVAIAFAVSIVTLADTIIGAAS